MTQSLEKAQEFMWCNARLLERHLFSLLFGDGAKEPVLAALRPYQNSDGGFGHGLEPDKRSPESQPQDVEFALHILDMADIYDEQIVAQICNFLDNISTAEGGVPFALPSVRKYPRAPWWETDDNPPASLNPTAAIVGLLHKFGTQHSWLDKASAFCWREIEKLDSDEYHTLMPVITFLEHAPERARAEEVLSKIAGQIVEKKLVALEVEAEGYVQKPLDWTPSPDSYCHKLFTPQVLEAHLTALLQQQKADGGWDVSWEPISEGVRLEWRRWVTIKALNTLQAYGKL